MSENPLKQYFRQAAVYVKLPSLGRWYADEDVKLNDEGEVAVYSLTALDDIMLNTPDAMLNGSALEKVIKNCVPDVKNVKKLMLPDVESIFVGIKSASNSGKVEIDRECPSCKHENTFDILCQNLLDGSTYIADDDLTINFNNELMVHIRPYDFEMRQLFTKKQFEEERMLRAIDQTNTDMDEISKAEILGQSVDRLSTMTFNLVSRSIEKIVLLKDNVEVTDRNHINEWLIGITKAQADLVIDAVDKLNNTGVTKKFNIICQSCGHQWTDQLSFDPSSFFGKRS